MIIDFTVKNYLSIKDEITFSFLSNNKNIDENLNIIPVDKGKYNLYSFSAIYGPNASGKSNLVKALKDLKNFILSSQNLHLGQDIPFYKPFELDIEYKSMPTYFQIEFIIQDVRYIYEVEFLKRKILRENLLFYPKGSPANLFTRNDKSEINFGSYFTGEKQSLVDFLIPNKLFLSVAANSKNKILQPIYKYFLQSFNIHSRMDSTNNPLIRTTLELSENKDTYKNLLIVLLKAADINVEDIKIKEDRDIISKINLPESMPEDFEEMFIDGPKKYKPFLGHKVFKNGTETRDVKYFDLMNEESTGTIKMYDLASEIIYALKNGTVLIIDEFNSGLHPSLNKFIVELFNSSTINKNNAQLLITTHDTCIMDFTKLKKEQLWFTDKNKYGSTDLYSLNEFDSNQIRDYSKYSKNYIGGRFKAVPSTYVYNLIKELFDA